MKNILSLTSIQAKEFFLKNESYCSIDLPGYFQFSEVLMNISNEIAGKKIHGYFNSEKKNRSEKLDNVNYKIFHKKGKYSWRPLQLINPILYVSLVHEITQEENWKAIQERFHNFQENPRIKCTSIPVISEILESNRSSQIMNWIDGVEKDSLSLGLEYTYLFQSDIADCYPSIYTHSIAWSLHDRSKAKEGRDDKNLLGNIIDCHIQWMSSGQTNGIPQGSSLMNFIAEMVLGYADTLLTEKLKNKEEYQIIRYRDDYRIFVNNPQLGEEILKNLTDILIGLGLKLKGEKTHDSNNIIQNSIKSDKLYELVNINTSKITSKELFIIHTLGEKFPDSGVVAKRLHKLSEKISRALILKENPRVIISILVAIALKNPRTYHIVIAILSKIISFIESGDEKKEILSKIQLKFSTLPNTEHLDIWLQRISIKLFPEYSYPSDICKAVAGEKVQIWNCNGFNKKIQKLVNKTPIIDQNILLEMDSIISISEIAVFQKNSYSYNQ